MAEGYLVQGKGDNDTLLDAVLLLDSASAREVFILHAEKEGF